LCTLKQGQQWTARTKAHLFLSQFCAAQRRKQALIELEELVMPLGGSSFRWLLNVLVLFFFVIYFFVLFDVCRLSQSK
jgi:hypothetical protein